MAEVPKIIRSIGFIEPDLLQVEFHDNVTITVDDLKQGFEKIDELSGDRKIKKIIITGKRTEITKDARLYGYNHSLQIKDKIKAEAIIVHSLYQKMVINFYFRFIKESYPCRYFNDVEKAREWLSAY